MNIEDYRGGSQLRHKTHKADHMVYSGQNLRWMHVDSYQDMNHILTVEPEGSRVGMWSLASAGCGRWRGEAYMGPSSDMGKRQRSGGAATRARQRGPGARLMG
jgi:hypothetical protein